MTYLKCIVFLWPIMNAYNNKSIIIICLKWHESHSNVHSYNIYSHMNELELHA